MKRFLIALAGVSIAASALPATAQPWESMGDRQRQVARRIDQGVRSGALTRAEAQRLRGQFRALMDLETRYRRSPPGLTRVERNDLNRRFEALSRQLFEQKHDRDHRR